MSLFSRILSKKNQKPTPSVQFGRFCDGYKTPQQLVHWENALKFFVSEKYLDSFESLLSYLNDPEVENVKWTKSNGVISFTLFQGSKLISGEVSALHVWAKSVIAGFSTREVGWMRILLEENFHMLYSRYAINDQNEMIIIFDNFIEEASPHKIVEALRELAIRADKLDDVLLSDFSYLKPLENNHIIPIPNEIKESKFRFFKNKTDEVKHLLDHPPHEFLSYKASFMYMILACGYSLDYLIKPEGKLMKCIEQCHTQYFNETATDPDIKIKHLIQNFSHLFTIEKNTFMGELYDTRSTFGLDLPVGTNSILEVIEAQWSDLEWFFENEYYEVHRFMCDYVVGFSLFSMSLPKPYKELLHMYYRITEETYFTDLGFDPLFTKEGKIGLKQIVGYMKQLKSNEKTEDLVFQPEVSVLKADHIHAFRHSFILMLKNTLEKE